MNKRKLTEKTLAKYKAVVDKWFVVKFNGAEAYRAFYPNIKKDETATVNFSRIQRIPEIKTYIAEKHEEASKLVEMDHEGILQELKGWLELDITETFGMSKEELKLLPAAVRRLITGCKEITKKKYNKEGKLVFEVTTYEPKFVSKEKAIDMIAKHIGFFAVDNSQKANDINIYSSNDKHLSIIQGIINGN